VLTGYHSGAGSIGRSFSFSFLMIRELLVVGKLGVIFSVDELAGRVGPLQCYEVMAFRVLL